MDHSLSSWSIPLGWDAEEFASQKTNVSRPEWKAQRPLLFVSFCFLFQLWRALISVLFWIRMLLHDSLDTRRVTRWNRLGSIILYACVSILIRLVSAPKTTASRGKFLISTRTMFTSDKPDRAYSTRNLQQVTSTENTDMPQVESGFKHRLPLVYPLDGHNGPRLDRHLWRSY
jgi:hypothetical protein